MASDIIAQGMAAAANKKASLALEKVEGVTSGIKYIGEVDYYENLPSNPNLGDGYTVKYKTGGTNPDGREFVWGKTQDGTKKWIEFGPDLDPIITELAKKKGASGTAEGAEIFNDYTTNKATGIYSHAEGYHTKANSDYQHAQGKYNIEDTNDTYAHIVGNGVSDTERSNAHTLDWSGNAWYAGKVSGGTVESPAPVENDNDYVTKKYFDENKVASSQIIDADLETLKSPTKNTYYRHISTNESNDIFKALSLGDAISEIEIRQALSTTEMNSFLDGLDYTSGTTHVLIGAPNADIIIARDESNEGFDGLKLLVGLVQHETYTMSIIYANQDFDLSASDFWSQVSVNTTGNAGWQLDNGIYKLSDVYTINLLSNAVQTLNGVVFRKKVSPPYESGAIYFFDGGGYYIIDGKEALSIAPIDTLNYKDYTRLLFSNSLKIVNHYTDIGIPQNLLSVSNNIGFKKYDAIYSIVFNTSITTKELDNYLSKFNPVIGIGISEGPVVFPLIETYNYYGLYGAQLSLLGGTGYVLAICNAIDPSNFTVLQIVYVSEYSQTNLALIQNLKPGFTYTTGGWQDTSEYVFDSVIFEVANFQTPNIKQSLIDEMVCYVNTDKHLWRGIKKLSQNRDICNFTINPSEWIESPTIAPFKYMVSKTYALDVSIDEDCPLMNSFDNLINSAGVAIAEITGTDSLNIVFYAVNKPTVEITGTIGGVV